MRSKSNIKEEPYLAVVLVAILSVPMLVTLLSGCSQKKEPGIVLGKITQAEPVSRERKGAAPRVVLDPASRKARAREAVERARKAARSRAKQSSTVRVNSAGRLKKDSEIAKQAEGSAAGSVENLGNKQLVAPGTGAGGNEEIDAGSSPARTWSTVRL